MPESDNVDEGAAVKRGRSTKRKARGKRKPKSKMLPPFNVVLLDDNDHTYDYVVEMLRKVFGYTEQRGDEIAQVVDKSGRAIVMTTHKELAELKRDQIIGFGADPRLSKSNGPMNSVVEPAEG